MNRIAFLTQRQLFQSSQHRFTHQDPAGDFDRRAHFRRSLSMTLITLLIGLALFAAFFALVAAADHM